MNPLPPRVDAVLFDKDGTLIDSLGPWAEAESLICRAIVDGHPAAPENLGKRSAAVTEALAAVGVAGGAVDPNGILATSGGDANLDALRRSLSTSLGGPLGCLSDPSSFALEFSRILHALYPLGMQPFRPMPGAGEALRALSEAGIPLGLATSDDRRMSLRQLEAFGWKERFAFMAFGDTAPRRKPDPWMAQEFSRVLKVDLSRIAVIGDTPADYGMARSAGVRLFVKVAGSIEGLAPFLLGSAIGEEAAFAAMDFPA